MRLGRSKASHQLSDQRFCESLSPFRVKVKCVKVKFGLLKKIERVSRQGNSRSLNNGTWKNRIVTPGKSWKLYKWSARDGREHNRSGTIRITIHDSWNPIAL